MLIISQKRCSNLYSQQLHVRVPNRGCIKWTVISQYFLCPFENFKINLFNDHVSQGVILITIMTFYHLFFFCRFVGLLEQNVGQVTQANSLCQKFNSGYQISIFPLFSGYNISANTFWLMFLWDLQRGKSFLFPSQNYINFKTRSKSGP